jgi:hypothetical protein
VLSCHQHTLVAADALCRRGGGEEEALKAVYANPSTSTRRVTHETGPSQSAVWRTPHEGQLSSFHVQRIIHPWT